MSRPGVTLRQPAGSATEDPLAAATASAAAAAQLAAVRIVMPDDLDSLAAAAAVWHRVWGTDGEPPVSREMLRALSRAGNYLSAAYAGDRVVGALLGFYGGGADGVDRLHSHILGVDSAAAGNGVGFALKLHQRQWALQHGLTRMTWTYDPLVRRNGHFNLVKLGARGVDYLVDFYGPMPDAINGGDPSDRILVEWDLSSSSRDDAPGDLQAWIERGSVIALDTVADRPARLDAAASSTLLCATPDDIVALRRNDPTAAHQWRLALREVLQPALARGLHLTAMAPGGWYVVSG